MQEKSIKQKKKGCFKNKKVQLEGETFKRKQTTKEKKYSMDKKQEDASIKKYTQKITSFSENIKVAITKKL